MVARQRRVGLFDFIDLSEAFPSVAAAPAFSPVRAAAKSVTDAAKYKALDREFEMDLLHQESRTWARQLINHLSLESLSIDWPSALGLPECPEPEYALMLWVSELLDLLTCENTTPTLGRLAHLLNQRMSDINAAHANPNSHPKAAHGCTC